MAIVGSLSFPRPIRPAHSLSCFLSAQTPNVARLGGDDETVRTYDTENIFKYLTFYLDDDESAADNGLPFPELKKGVAAQ
jgi:hypothetical protein